MSVIVHHGDCLDVLPTLPADSVDACVCDPPYHLTSIVKRFAKEKSWDVEQNFAARRGPGQGVSPYARTSRGFMGKQWDGGDIAFRPETWAAVYRVLKPGGHLIAFSGTRTYHRMACAVEDAGFEIRDMLAWLYGSGFPKSHDIGKAIDRAAGVERKLTRAGSVQRNGYGDDWDTGSSESRPRYDEPATALAKQWEGWGTALKPAMEPHVLARKPLIGTVAANVLAHGTGALNIDGCRIPVSDYDDLVRVNGGAATWGTYGSGPNNSEKSQSLGRWPANVIHDGSEEVLQAFPETGKSTRAEVTSTPGAVYGNGAGLPSHTGVYGFDDAGTAARFFYTAKADKGDRLGSKHPTVKPVDLIAYLCRLITPPGGTVLDPFAGSGTTGMACMREGFRAILIEREAEYVADIRRRLQHVKGEDAPLFAGSAA